MFSTPRNATLVLGLAALLTGCATQGVAPASASTEASCGKTQRLGDGQVARSVAPGRWVTLKELAASLPPGPVDVGFDIDDTLIFPSPGFQAVLFSKEGPGGSNPYGADMRAVVANPKTWQDLHHQHDAYALPKAIGRELLALHQQRGDRIHLITARVGIEGAALEARMRKFFGLEFAGPIVFTALKPKTEAIRARKLALYYGDSDSDIEAAQAAGIRGVRVLRATNAVAYDKGPCFGKFGEDVIIDSDV
ncbi:MAG: acid phosphatase AphA [Ideonella sp. MAG2]|nr:MAG: acid phosphatase AphA [Ideonella sp. MAG2]